jgi:sulfatase modifying factor 1
MGSPLGISRQRVPEIARTSSAETDRARGIARRALRQPMGGLPILHLSLSPSLHRTNPLLECIRISPMHKLFSWMAAPWQQPRRPAQRRGGLPGGWAPLIACGLALAGLAWLAGGCDRPPVPSASTEGMVWIEGGEFSMGSDARLAQADERPAHPVRVDGFWMDSTEVTNAQFRKFAEATGFVTDAERPPDLAALMAQVPPGTPPPPVELLVPGSLIFTPPQAPGQPWWEWRAAANWRRPEGPTSDLSGRGDHPVVHVSWQDATAYADWAGKRLPTEAEWEFAARGGLDAAPFVWGDQNDDLSTRMNTWQGQFPNVREKGDGYADTSPVGSFPPNGYGLYDVAGNVWEWVADWYRPDTYPQRAGDGVVVNPTGPKSSFDPDEPYSPKRVCRGGSYLCSDNYCTGYRPSARMKSSPDTSLAHTGFRCVKDQG